MKKLTLLISSVFLFGWNMKGFTSPTSPPNTQTWCYQNGWKNNFNYGNFPQITQIEGGEACWIYDNIQINTNSKTDTYIWHTGWNFVTPIFEDWNISEKFKNYVPFAWKYKNNKWYLYSITPTDYNYTFSNVNIGEGVWIYLNNLDISIANKPLICENGLCNTIITTLKNFNIKIKANSTNNIKIAIDLYRYSNNTHYRFGIGPFDIENNEIQYPIYTAAEKESNTDLSSATQNMNSGIEYQNGYIILDLAQIAQNLNKSLPSTSENFKIDLYVQNMDLNNSVNGSLNFTLGDFSINGKKIEFEMETK